MKSFRPSGREGAPPAGIVFTKKKDVRPSAPSGVSTDRVNVFARFRPPSDGEDKVVVECKGDHNKVLTFGRKGDDNLLEFALDGVLDEEATQRDVFELSAQSYVTSVLSGKNATVMAYGQTGAGKTHAMFGPDDLLTDFASCDPSLYGIIPRALSQLFNAIDPVTTTVSCSFLELYVDKVNDLLISNSRFAGAKNQPVARRLREGRDGFFVEGLIQEDVGSVAAAMDLIKRGSDLRTVSEMNMNKRSSRGHAIFGVHITSTSESGEQLVSATLNLVDLAGMESAVLPTKGASAVAERRNETKAINTSLHALSKIVEQLVKPSGVHVAWRDSSLTKLLQESLGGNTRSSILVTCRSEESNFEQTTGTLRFATTALGIATVVTKNVTKTAAGAAADAQSELENMRAELKAAKQQLASYQGGSRRATHRRLQLTEDGAELTYREAALEEDANDAWAEVARLQSELGRYHVLKGWVAKPIRWLRRLLSGGSPSSRVAPSPEEAAKSAALDKKCKFFFVPPSVILEAEALPRFQELRDARKLIEKPVRFADAVRGKYRNEMLIVSHRWEAKTQPDPDNAQLLAVQEHLRKHPDLALVWIDWCCMPQGERTAAEKVEFKRMLPRINMLYIGGSVLLLVDSSSSRASGPSLRRGCPCRRALPTASRRPRTTWRAGP